MLDFLEFLYGGKSGFVEMRYWYPIGQVVVQRQWHDIAYGLRGLIDDARHYDRTGHEVYVGVLPRIRDHGGTAEDVTRYTNLLWADIDANDHEDSKRKALDAVLEFPVAPQVIVDSGRGLHAYWRLDRSYLFDDVQPIMKGIAKRIGGDVVYDRARILRLPGLSNHKGGGNAPVRLLRFDTTSSFLLSDLQEFRFAEPMVTHAPREYRINIPGLELQAELACDPGKGARSEHDFAVACKLIELGWTDGEIVKAFLDHPQGVGAKTAKSGLRYLERTIAAAHRAVGR